MASNRIQINSSSHLIYEVPDSKMPEIMALLNEHGELQPPELSPVAIKIGKD